MAGCKSISFESGNLEEADGASEAAVKKAWIWIIPAALGISFDILFWKQRGGLDFPLYVVLCMLGGLLVLRARGVRVSLRTLQLLPLVLLFAAIPAIRAEPLTALLSVIATLFLMSVLALSAVDGRWLNYDLLDYVVGFVSMGVGAITRPLAELLQTDAPAQAGRSKHQMLRRVLVGVLLLIPILLALATLLASADTIFARQLGGLLELFQPQTIFRLVLVLSSAYLLGGIFLFAASRTAQQQPASERFTYAKPLSTVETSVVFGGILLLFVAFVVVQFQYLFGGQANISETGFTYAEYARRGFGELIAVAALSLLTVLGLGAFSRLERNREHAVFSGMAAVIFALVGVILYSAHIRLQLYEQAYGYSQARAYAHILLYWVAALFAVIIVLELMRRRSAILISCIVAALGFVLTLGIGNVDAAVAQRNIEQANAGEKLDLAYLVTLSNDATPVLAFAYGNEALPLTLRLRVGAALACRADQRRLKPLTTDWRSYRYSDALAAQTVALHKADIATQYSLGDDGTVTAPGGAVFDCYGQTPAP